MRYVYANENGDAVMVYVAPQALKELTVQEILQKDCPVGSNPVKIQSRDMPPDAIFRPAWKFNGTKIFEDVEKSKEVKKDILRKQREPLLAEQDVLFMKALEDGVDTKVIKDEKQRLRDITKLVDTCTTMEEIRAIKIEK